MLFLLACAPETTPSSGSVGFERVDAPEAPPAWEAPEPSSECEAVLRYLDEDGDGWGDAPGNACPHALGFSDRAGDCDDRDPTTHPGAPEHCDDRDHDCDGDSHDVAGLFPAWADGDRDGYGAGPAEQRCDLPEGWAMQQGDCDDEAPGVHPGAEESCDARDEDCDGAIDEGLDVVWWVDADGDGYGSEDLVTEACARPPSHVAIPGDCDDRDPSVNPAGAEVCDGVDQDCDGVVDDGVLTTCWPDEDGDGVGAGTAIESCEVPSGYSTSGGDCDDADPDRSPSLAETCWDGTDEDCDGLVDCEDSDCAAECVETDCSDGADDDGDGDVDCDDDDCLAACFTGGTAWAHGGRYEWSWKESYHSNWIGFEATSVSGSVQLSGLATTTCTWTADRVFYSVWSGVETRGLAASSDCPVSSFYVPRSGKPTRTGLPHFQGVVTTSWSKRSYRVTFSSTYSSRGYWDTHSYASGTLTTGVPWTFTPSF